MPMQIHNSSMEVIFHENHHLHGTHIFFMKNQHFPWNSRFAWNVVNQKTECLTKRIVFRGSGHPGAGQNGIKENQHEVTWARNCKDETLEDKKRSKNAKGAAKIDQSKAKKPYLGRLSGRKPYPLSAEARLRHSEVHGNLLDVQNSAKLKAK